MWARWGVNEAGYHEALTLGTLPLEPDDETLRELLRSCSDFALEEITSLPAQPAADVEDFLELAESFDEPAPERGEELGALLERLRPAIRKSFNTAGPGYLAYIPGGGIPAAAAADLIASAANRYVGVRQAAPVLVQIETTVLQWMATWLGYPPSARGVLTSGGSLSNLSALVTARAERLGESFLDGVVYVSEQTHHSIAKAARIAGIRAANVRVVPTDDRFRMRVDALEAAVRRDREAGRRPFLVVASVGTTNTGAIDPIREILDLARRQELWVHADAAYGGFFALVPEARARMAGLDECDSITLDPHKGLFLPYGTGCLLVRDGEALRRAHASQADYMQDLAQPDAPTGFTDLSPELSRDFRGLRVWLPLKLYGVGAFRDQLVEKLALTRRAYEALREDGRFELFDEPQLSVIAFALRGSGDDANRRSEELRRRVNARGRVFLSSTRVRNRFALRICVLSFRTHAERVDDAVAALREEARALEPATG